MKNDLSSLWSPNEEVKKKSNLAIKTLKNICGVETNLTTYHLGYILGPRINAGGRVGKCSHGANLLLSKDSKEIFKIASELENFNTERKKLEKNMIEDIERNINLNPNDPIILLSGHNWHGGIIGINFAGVAPLNAEDEILLKSTIP